MSPLNVPLLICIGLSLLIRMGCLGSTDLLVEEAYYWNYAQHLDWSYLDHPPMVALLIRAFTDLFGLHAWAVRLPSMLCWAGAAYFSFKLTEWITRGAGLIAVFLVAILPFFFLQSLVMTPDQPLLLCWSATLYCLYRAQVLEEPRYWYAVGIWLGLGMLSKYTIVLVGVAALLYACTEPHARKWFLRREPYIAVLIAFLLFMPVLYWNATHEWASFVFQSARRMKEAYTCSLHELIGLWVLFLTPLGCIGFVRLWINKNRESVASLFSEGRRRNLQTLMFLKIYTGVPLLVFAGFSLTHAIKFNWIGPGLLAVIPWLAHQIKTAQVNAWDGRKGWLITAFILLLGYSGMLGCIMWGVPATLHQAVFSKYIAWEDLTRHVYDVAHRVEEKTHKAPIIIPLDRYNIGSELAFYQGRLHAQHKISQVYSIRGSHVFGGESLMYRYWSMDADLPGQTLLLISDNPAHFDNPSIEQLTQNPSTVASFWAHSPKQHTPIRRYYYQTVQMKSR